MTPRVFFLWTLAGAVGLRLFLAIVTPPLFAADEAGHLLYIHEIALHHVLPIQTLDGIWANNNGAEDFYHTPIYYLLMAPLYRAMWPAHVVLYVLRITSVGFGVVTVVVIHSMVKEHFPRWSWAPEFAALFAAFQPAFVAVTSAVSIDALSLLLMTVALQRLARVVRDGASVSQLLFLCALLSIGVYVKVSILVIFPAFLLAAVLNPAPKYWQRFLVLLPPVFALAAVLPWWVLRNLSSYGSLLALDMNWAVLAGPLWVRIVNQTLYMSTTFWFGLGRTTEILNPLWVSLPLWALLYVCGRRGLSRLNRMDRSQKAVLFIAFAVLAAGFAQSLEYGVKWGFSQGRYLLPGLLFLSLIFGLGMARTADEKGLPKRAATVAAATGVMWLLFISVMTIPGFARVQVDHSVGGLDRQPAFRTGDIETWVLRRTAPLRAEDACKSATHSRFSRPC